MIRNLFIFLGTFVAGALIALVIRAARFAPNTSLVEHPAAGGKYSPMVANPLVPAKTSDQPNAPATAMSAAADPHAGHGAALASVPATQPVNTVCAICGMGVDPKIPTLEYQGKKIGFGCKMCPPKFQADPDRYGPFYLRNEVIKK